MPVYQMRAPDGNTYQIEGPEGATDEEVKAEIIRQNPQLGASAAPPAPEKAGFFSSIANTAGTLGSALSAIGFTGAETPEEQAAAREKLIADETPEGIATRFEDIKDASSAWDWFKQTAGSSLGFLVAPGVSAAAAGVAKLPFLPAKAVGYGVLGAQYLITNLTRQAQEQKAAIEAGETPDTTSLGKAIIASAGQTGLDMLQFGTVFKPIVSKFPVIGKLVGAEGAQVAKQTEKELIEAFDAGKFSVSGGIVRGLAAGAAFEIPQEIAQQMFERWQAGAPLSGDDAAQEYLEAGVGALALGGSMGALSGFIDSASKQAAAQEAKDEQLAGAQEEYEAQKEEAQRVAQEEADRQAELDALSKDAPEGNLKGTEALAKLFEDAKAFAANLPEGSPDQWKAALRQQFPDLEAGYDNWLLKEFEKNGVAYKDRWGVMTKGPKVKRDEQAPKLEIPKENYIDLQQKAYEFLKTLPSETDTGQWAQALTDQFNLHRNKGYAYGLLKDALSNNPDLFHRQGRAGLYGQGPKPKTSLFQENKNKALHAFDQAVAAMPLKDRGFYEAERKKLSSAAVPAALDTALKSLQPTIDQYSGHVVDGVKARNETSKKVNPFILRAQSDAEFAKALGPQVKDVATKLGTLYRGTKGKDALMWTTDEEAAHQELANDAIPQLEQAVTAYDEKVKADADAAKAAAKAQKDAEAAAAKTAKEAERAAAKAKREADAKTAAEAKAKAKAEREAAAKIPKFSEDNINQVLNAFTSNPEFADRTKPIKLTATKIGEMTGLNKMTAVPSLMKELQKRGHIEKQEKGGYSLPAKKAEPKKGKKDAKPAGSDTGTDGAATGAGTAGTTRKKRTKKQGAEEAGTGGVGTSVPPATGTTGGTQESDTALKPKTKAEKEALKKKMGEEGKALYKDDHLSMTDAAALERHLNAGEFEKAEGYLKRGRKDRQLMQEAAAESARSETDTQTYEDEEVLDTAELDRRKKEIDEGGSRALAYSGRDEVTSEEKSEIERAVDESASDPAVFLDKLAELTSNKFYKYMAQLMADRIRELQKIGVRTEVEITDTITDAGKNRKDYAGLVTTNLSRQIRNKLDRVTIQLRTNKNDGRNPQADGRNYVTAVHEAIHAVTIGLTYVAKNSTYLVSRETANAVKELEKVHAKALAAVKKIGTKPSHTWTDVEAAAWKLYQESNAFDNLDELIAQTFSNIDMQQFLNTVKYPAKGGWRTLFNDFIAAIRNLIGITIKDDSALEAVVKATSVLMNADLADAHYSYTGAIADAQAWLNNYNKAPSGPQAASRKAAKVKVAPPIRNETHDERARRKAGQTGAKAKREEAIKETGKALMTEKGYEEAVRLLQNERRPIKTLQDFLEKAKKLIVTGDFNNLYDHIVLSTGKAFNAMTEHMQGHIDRIDRGVLEYATARGIDPTLALGYLQTYYEAKHEPERRLVKFLMNVGLNTKKITQLDQNIIPQQSPLYNVKASAAELRDLVLAELGSNKNLVSNGYAEKYRQALNELIYRNPTTATRADGTTYEVGEFMDNTVDGYTTARDMKVVGMSFDINDRVYDVIGAYSQEQLQEDRDAYENDKHKAIVDRIYENMKRLQNATIRLDKETNYWSKPVDNIKHFYGWDYYIPMKGRGDRVLVSDDRFNFNSPRLGAGYNDTAIGFTGRSSDSDNPVLQVMVDATKASLRYGRKDITTALKNLVNQKHIKGKKFTTINFRDRFAADLKFNPSSDKFFFEYKSDGTIDIYEIQDTRMKEAIRREFTKSNPIVNMANNLTGAMGHLHTRYNVSFHPYNFVRDALTNAFTMGAEMGPGKAASLIKAVAARVGRSGGMTKAMKVSKLYAEGRVAEIRTMAQTDSFVREVLEYLDEGGRISYIQGLSNKSQAQEMLKDIERGGFSRHKEGFDKWVDTWADGFEFTSRAATYAVMKSEYMAQGMTEAEARTRAASYAKNIANFEQVGKYGRQMGAFYMFFRPAATGAVRAIDALKPAFQSVESVLASVPDSLRSDAEAMENIKKDHLLKQKNARHMIYTLLGMGATLYLMAMMASDDDEQGRNKIQTDDMSLWTRNIRLPLNMFGDKDSYLQIPWGFGLGAFGAMGAQVAGVAFGKTSITEAMPNFVSIALDSYMPIPFERIDPKENFAAFAVGSMSPSLARPFLEWAMNVDSLGREIYNNRLNKYGDAFTGGANVPEAYRDLSRWLLKKSNVGIDVQPTTLQFWANNYADGIARIGHGLYGLNKYFTGEKPLDLKADFPLISSYIGRKSNYDGREFASVESQLKAESARLTSLEFRPELYRRYVEDHPYMPMVVNHFNGVVNNQLKDIRSAKKAIEASDLPATIRKERLDALRINENYIKRNLINLYRQYGVEP